MRAHFRKRMIAACLCTAACSDGTGSLDGVTLCPNSSSWAAIQREGEEWQSIPVTPRGVSLRPGERIGLASIAGAPGVDTLRVNYVTAEQAEATFPCEPAATKELHGTVRGGPTSGAYFGIAMGESRTFATLSFPDFTLRAVPNGPTDLVATSQDGNPITIFRRGVDYPAGSTVPVLDFGSAEPFALQANALTVSGASTFNGNVETQVLTRHGTHGMLRQAATNQNTVTIYSVPATRLETGELNSLTVLGPDANTLTVYYRSPSDRTVQLGPRASSPTLTRTGTAPNRTAQVDQPSQPEYGAQVSFTMCALRSTGGTAYSIITATREYFGGTPATWSLTTPNLTAVQGFPSSFPDVRQAGLCGVSVTDRPYLFSPRSARDGDTYRSAQAPGVIYTP